MRKFLTSESDGLGLQSIGVKAGNSCFLGLNNNQATATQYYSTLQPALAQPPLSLTAVEVGLLLSMAVLVYALVSVVSGFLAGHVLLTERRMRRRMDLTGFFLRRWLRMIPALLLALVLARAIFPGCTKWDVASLFFANNLLGPQLGSGWPPNTRAESICWGNRLHTGDLSCAFFARSAVQQISTSPPAG